jgi:fatty-acyl-CoA synthase
MQVEDLFRASSSSIILPDGSVTAATELHQQGTLLADRLRAALSPGERIAVKLPNGLTYLQLIVACAVGRLVLVSVNTRYTDAEVNELVNRSGARLLVSDPSDLEQFPLAQRVVPLEPADRDGSDPYLVFTTSGTTSKPKLVRHQQRSIAQHGIDAAAAFRYSPQDRVLVVMPFCGTFGFSSLTSALAGNAHVIVADRADVQTIGGLIEKHRITACNASDDLFHRLVEAGCDLSSVRLGGYARFNSSLDGIVERAQHGGALLTGLYGMSEVQALYALRSPALDTAQRSAAGGTPVAPTAAFRVIDGELQLRGPSLFEGYLHEGGQAINATLTAAAFDDGWFRTGDAAAVDALGSFTYHARLNDVLRLGGFLVSPAEIESVLLSAPGVAQAQVVSVDRPTGSRPVAFIIPMPGAKFDEADVIAHCGSSLARFKVPVRVIALEEFPSTPSANGTKIQLVRLRELAEQAI